METQGVMYQLGVLVKSWERGEGAYEYSARLHWPKFLKRPRRRCRLLVASGWAEEVRAMQPGFVAFSVTPAGIARWDRHFFTAS